MIGASIPLVLACAAAQSDASAREASFWEVQYYQPPEHVVLEVGGLGFLPDGRLAVSTRRGQVWLVEEPLANDAAKARFHLFAQGLQEGLGLAVVDGEILVVQRGELSRVRDEDGDGVADAIDTISNAWGLSGNYHEFAYGLPIDEKGNAYVSLNVGFWDPQWWHGKSRAPWRGWVVRIAPDGTMEPFASGFRSPCGIGRNSAGDIFVTDNQGDWVASSPLYHVVEGAFYGHPASLAWTDEFRASGEEPSDTLPPARKRKPPAIWIPYEWSRSTGNMVEDTTGGRFGPFEGDLFLAELTNGMVLRAGLERVRGEYQGWVTPFRQRVGSATRVAFAPDGSLIIGFTNRGWGGQPPGHGLARIRWTGRVPMEVERVQLLRDGFEIAFTEPLAAEVSITPAQITARSYDYDYWWEYGSPERHDTPLTVGKLVLSADRRKLALREMPLVPATCVRIRLDGIVSATGQELLHREFAYTINQLPVGPVTAELVAKTVEPPLARETGREGWLHLTDGDPLDAWTASGWSAGEVELDESDRSKLRLAVHAPENGEAREGDEDGNGERKRSRREILNVGDGAPSHLVSEQTFGDAKVHAEFMLPEGGNSGVYLMGRYEVQLQDSAGKTELSFGDCGGIYRGESWPGAAPKFDAFDRPGRWHDLDVEFEAPRFDEEGRKVRDARFVRVRIDDVLLHENVEVPEPTIAALFADEAAVGPLVLQGDHGPVGFRNVRVFPLGRTADDEGWTALFDGESTSGWTADGDAKWEIVEGVLRGSGARGHLFTERDFGDVDVRARVRISDGGNSGLYVRATPTGEWPVGYEAQINSTQVDPQKTASLYGLAEVHGSLVPPDTWFDYEVRCRDEAEGTRLTILVNDVVVTDHLDRERKHARGRVALQQHHDGSVIEVGSIEVRER